MGGVYSGFRVPGFYGLRMSIEGLGGFRELWESAGFRAHRRCKGSEKPDVHHASATVS